jgi:hypothetical protein
VRSNILSTFNHTRAECMCAKSALRSNVKVDVRTYLCNSVCVWWGTAVEHTKVSSYAAPYTRSNVHDTFERIMQTTFFFFLRIFTK